MTLCLSERKEKGHVKRNLLMQEWGLAGHAKLPSVKKESHIGAYRAMQLIMGYN
jgi:hypothetical protein